MKQNLQIATMVVVVISAATAIRASDGIKRAAHTGPAILGIGSSFMSRRSRAERGEEK